MELQPQLTLIDKLGDMGEKLPGLNLDKIVENLAKKAEPIKAQYDSIKEEADELKNRGRITKDEATKMVKDKIKALVEEYKKKITQMVRDAINEIQSAWKEIKTQIKQIPKDVKNAIQAILVPPAIGVPPVAPNPIYAITIAAQTKSILAAILNSLATNLIKLLKAASMISFVVPAPVLAAGTTIKTLGTIVNSIPA